ncbi:ABC transporter permease [Pinisolibacter aquiterrae]|uniref:ABC transporter permease n=1 Tax=Pinisolibacter aquiterrae TaxID=2815579 RepID=UPI001E3E692F|nr:ABC transporter permease [Pinisolibacter aquiterrae]
MPPSLNRFARRLAAALLPLALLVAAWGVAVAVLAPPPYLLPGPDRVVLALIRQAGPLAENGAITALEIVLGLLGGVVLGVGTAVIMTLIPWTARLLMPAIVVIQALPVFAIAPVLVLWFGFGLASKIVMATLVIFFPVTASLHDGLSRLDPGLVDLARLHKATRFDTFRFLRLPAAVPALVSGLRMAATVAPIGAIIGEWVGASKGLGLLMMHANARLQTDVMFAALLVLAVMAVALRGLVEILTRRWAPWAPETGPAFL